MTAITQQVLVEAVLHLERLSFAARQQLADEIYAQQPNLLASIVVLQQYGATLEQMESVLNLLLVWYEAMQRSGRSWPLITEDDIHLVCWLGIVGSDEGPSLATVLGPRQMQVGVPVQGQLDDEV